MNTRLLSAVWACALVVSMATSGLSQLTSEQAQALLDEALAEGTAEVLGVRRVSGQESIARVKLAELENVKIDVTFVLVDAGWLPGGNVELMGQSFPFARLSGVIDRDRQDRTMGSMRYIATANWVMRDDTGRYAENLIELAPRYLTKAILDDAWGNPFVYVTGTDTYTVTSLGSDGAAGPAPPMEWSEEPYDPDLVLTDGLFTQAPRGR